MSKSPLKKRKKHGEKRRAKRREGVEPSPDEGMSAMRPATDDAERHLDPRDGTAALRPITDEMMDHAAHEAAALADGVARGTIAPGHAEAREEAGASMAPVVAAPAGAAAQASEAEVEDAPPAAAARGGPSAAAEAMGQYNAKVVEMVRDNVASTADLFAALVRAKSLHEAVSLNADHVRRQIETLTTQGRDLAALAQKAAFDALKPLRDAVTRDR